MNAQMMIKSIILGTSLVSGAYAHHGNTVQTVIGAESLFPETLKSDSSNCDPKVIDENLKALKAADLLEVTNLTKTTAAGNHCYGPCANDVQEAVEKHCAKAEKLAQIVELL